MQPPTNEQPVNGQQPNSGQASSAPPPPPVFIPQQQPQAQQPANKEKPQPYVIEPVPVQQAPAQQQPNAQPQAQQPSGQQPMPAVNPDVSNQGTQAQPAPQMVYVARPLEPEQPKPTPEIQERHDKAKREYPNLNLSDGEYVIRNVKRHVIGLIEIWGVVVILMVLSLMFLGFYISNAGILSSDLTGAQQGGGGNSIAAAVAVLLLLNVLFIAGGIVATIVYWGNKFFLTNESVIQIIQHSLFSKREQTVSLANIEDASFLQKGILQHLFNYGSLRLSTEGEETTYRYNYVSNPSKQVGVLNNAVEAFKNGRPVSPDED